MKYFKYITIFLFILGLASLYYFRNDIKKAPVFKLKKIVITDISHYSFKDLIDRVAIDKNVSVFDIDLEEIEKNLLELSWIKKVRVTRILPNKISVSIKEHKIKGVVLFDILYFYNMEYSIFLKAYPSEIKKFTIYSGLTMNEYENDFNSFKKKLTVMENISELFKKSNLNDICSLSEVGLTDFRGYEGVLKCDDNDKYIRIILGFDDFLRKMNRSKVILKESKKRKENLKLVIFNEFKSGNSVLVRLENDEEEI